MTGTGHGGCGSNIEHHQAWVDKAAVRLSKNAIVPELAVQSLWP